MRRLAAFVLTAGVFLGDGRASAQQDVVFPGSTVEGDRLRGEGQFLKGMAWYNISAARARAIDEENERKWIAFNESMLGAYRTARAEAIAKDRELQSLRKEQRERALAEDERRYRTSPTPDDIESGKALNALLLDLSGPSSLSSWNSSEVPLPEGITLTALAFQFIPRRPTKPGMSQVKSCLVSLGRLDVKKWPFALSGAALADERRAYEQAYAKVVERCLAGSLDHEAIGPLDDALAALGAKVKDLPTGRGLRAEGVAFVKSLVEASAIFDASTADFAVEMIKDTHEHRAQTVGQLLAFMRKYRLMFAGAEQAGGAGDLYGQLYGLMREQKERLGIMDAYQTLEIAAAGRPTDLFNGRDLAGWDQLGPDRGNWRVERGVLVTEGRSRDWLCSRETYGDFELQLEFRMSPGANSGIYIRCPRRDVPSNDAIEIQLLDDAAPAYRDAPAQSRCGAIYAAAPAAPGFTKPAGEWNQIRIVAVGSKVAVHLNGGLVVDADLREFREQARRNPGIQRAEGFIGLQSWQGRVEFRNVRITAKS
ncbi:DUF1080 domain-containing protein [Paludisphaera sp.]|uniref:3-keto-disaccharide hydrolase n=1 Tax=Paludisphaera sp. TaxID=2017432 RepID=UPI00301D53D5